MIYLLVSSEQLAEMRTDKHRQITRRPDKHHNSVQPCYNNSVSPRNTITSRRNLFNSHNQDLVDPMVLTRMLVHPSHLLMRETARTDGENTGTTSPGAPMTGEDRTMRTPITTVAAVAVAASEAGSADADAVRAGAVGGTTGAGPGTGLTRPGGAAARAARPVDTVVGVVVAAGAT